MSSKNRKRRNRGNNPQLAQLVNRIDPNQLHTIYQNSIRMNPHLHHPGIVAGTASEDHVRRDFNTWFAGVQTGLLAARNMGGQQGRQQFQAQPQYQPQTTSLFGEEGASLFRGGPSWEGVSVMPERTTYPQNIQQGLQLAIRSLSSRGRVAA